MTRAVHRASFRPLAFASVICRCVTAALKIARQHMLLTLLALGLYSLSRAAIRYARVDAGAALLAPAGDGRAAALYSV